MHQTIRAQEGFQNFIHSRGQYTIPSVSISVRNTQICYHGSQDAKQPSTKLGGSQDDNWSTRKIREAIWIRRKQDNTNRDEGAYHIPQLYNHILKPRRGPYRPTTENTGKTTNCGLIKLATVCIEYHYYTSKCQKQLTTNHFSFM